MVKFLNVKFKNSLFKNNIALNHIEQRSIAQNNRVNWHFEVCFIVLQILSNVSTII